MAKAYRGECTRCDFQTPTLPKTPRNRKHVLRSLRDHVCAPREFVITPKQCQCCGRTWPLLVDDVLCIDCDSRLYPAVSL